MSRGSSGGTAADASPWTGDPLIGRILDGRYRIEDVLGTGGVGVVYRAEHLTLQRQVAIKVLHDQLGLIDELRIRFEREGQALSALSHPNVVAINDYGIADGTPFLVMELLEGRTLADLLDDDGPPQLEQAIDIARQILRGLSFAHARGIVHRDLKAANVFLQRLPDDEHHVKLLDFGLAKIFSTEEGEADPTLTKSGTILGTPAYMSPEQASGSSVDERADVYSAGVLLFELLTGRYPFEASTRADMIRAHMLEPVPTLREVRPALRPTAELESLVRRAMAKERTDRFVDAAAMLEALDALPRPAATAGPPDEGASSGRVSPDHASALETQAGDAPAVDGRALQAPPPGSSRTLARVVVAVGVVLLAITAALALWPGAEPPGGAGEGGRERPPAARAAAAGRPAGDDVQASGATAGALPREGAAGTSGGASVEAIVEAGGGAGEGEGGEAGDGESGAAGAGESGVSSPEGAARDPFLDVLPVAVRRYHLKVRAGERLSPRERRALAEVQRELPADPRPTLVLAHDFVDVGFFSDAVSRYERALAIDPTCRGDGRMLRDLVRIATGRSEAARAATTLVIAHYGAEAAPAIDAQLEQESDPEVLARLTRLRELLPR